MSRIDFDALEDEWEDGGQRPRTRNRELSVAARARIDQLDAARVVGVDRGRVTIVYAGEVVEARFAGTMRGEKAVVGDHVRVRPPRHRGDQARIVEVLERETVLTRTPEDTLDEERVVVANADLIVIVVAADHLTAGVGFVDRVLVAASVGGLRPAICINKMDLVAGSAALAVVGEITERYEAVGVDVRHTSAETGSGIEELALLIAGGWSAFTGHSGVGKSSLFNQLVPGADREVAALGPRGGRHTTVAAWAMPAPNLDAWLVDTPGVRSFGIGNLRPTELARHFPELAALDCRLDDCIHMGEPGCALPSAQVHPERLAAYHRLLASLRGDDWHDGAGTHE